MTATSDDAREEARLSLSSLLDDLRHVVGEIDENQWPVVAREVIDHHTPAIGDALLTEDQVQLQRWCRTMLEGLAVGDELSTKAAALKIRQFETSVDDPD